MHKILIQLLLLITLSSQKYHLVIYQAIDCPYCKFATKQIKSLITQYHLQQILNLKVIDCDHTVYLCRDSLNKPLLVLTNYRGQKIKEIGGVRSKLFFRDWILEVVDGNPMQIRQIQSDGKYKKKIIANPQEVVQFYQLYVQRQQKINNDKLNIFAEAYKFINQTQQNIINHQQQFISNGNFHFDLRSLTLSTIPFITLVFLLTLRKCQGNRRSRNTLRRIPIIQDEEDQVNQENQEQN